ncbi:MAG: PAS domain S-box protein [Bacteroidota bacterium]
MPTPSDQPTRPPPAPLSYVPSEFVAKPWPVVDWFVPDEATESNADALRRMRLLIVSVAVMVPLFLVASAGLISAGDVFGFQAMAAVSAAFLFASCPFVLRLTGSYVAAGTLFCLTLIGTQFFLATTDSGLTDTSLYFAPVIPLIAAFMVGPRVAVLCAALVIGEIGALYTMELGGYDFPQISTPDDVLWFTMLSIALTTLFCAALSWIYEGYTLVRLRRMNTRLQGLQGALEESEARYRSLFQNIPVGVYRSSPGGQVMMANQALVSMLGFGSAEEFATLDLERIYDGPEGRERFRDLMVRDGGVDQFESILLSRDGRKVYVRENARATFDDSGNVLYYEGTVEDVTEHLRAKHALRASEERFRALVQHSNDTITVIDRSGVIQYQSPSVRQNLGFEPDQTVGLSFMHLVHPTHQQHVQLLFERGLEQPGEFGAVEFWCRHASGHYIYVEAVGTNMLDNPWVGGIVLNSRDVTERKRSEVALVKAKEQAEEVARMKSAFLANMSHEIRTPLTGILGFAGVLAEEVEDEHREFVQLIEKSGKRLLETLNSVLDLARLEADQMEVDVANLVVGEQVEEVVGLLRPLAADKGLRLETVVESPHAKSGLDSGCLNRILNNLVGNAIKFTTEGHVTVRVTADSKRVTIQVQDSGIGIDAEFLPNLFEEFKQESTGIGRSHEGTGLGLTITRRLVEIMHGTIEVESRKGEGSTFTVSFPRVDAGAPVVEAEAAPDVEIASGPSHASVLVLDDNESARMLIGRMLRGSFDATIAGSFQEALTQAKARDFDLVLLDIHLSEDESGVELMKEMRAMPAYQDVPIIAFTAFALPGDRDRFLNEGFTGYLSKPFTKRQLLGILGSALDPDWAMDSE